MKFILQCILFFMLPCCMAQNSFSTRLSMLEDEELLELFNTFHGDSIQQEQIARTYLERARRAGDTIKMARGYDRLARIFHHEKNIAFADSIIFLTKNLQHKTYPALGYMIKSYEYLALNDLINASNNLFNLYEDAKLNDNFSHYIYALHQLIIIKSTWGDKNEALQLQTKRHELIFEEEALEKIKNSIRNEVIEKAPEILLTEQINSVFTYAYCYLNLNEFQKTEEYFQKLNELLLEYNGTYLNYYLERSLWIELELLRKRKCYSSLYEKSNEVLQSVSTFSVPLQFDIHYYLGVASDNLGYNSKALYHFVIADSLVQKNNLMIDPYHRDLYSNLAKMEELLDSQARIKYYQKLILIDSIFKINYKFFEREHQIKIRTPDRIEEKESQIESLNEIITRNQLILVSLTIMLVLILLYYYQLRMTYKRRFTKLFKSIRDERKSVSIKNISEENITSILESLKRFEGERGYLNTKLTLNRLAKNFDTNSNYLSRVINLKKEKNFSQYLHDLRISYATKRIVEDTKFRKYTIKAIAQECGYSSAESFSKAFYKINGIYPSYFIRKIEKRNHN
ncbi:helix-turn-helix domain-containing protein [Altibacter sp. HG106]|uniref:helix-turn-helix domain-containing protein n=1 Tax=Altibacter sp. HG106 TaxID=3023937 RepID=UPI0023506C71|nr:helix-turn-helix domain-containing protein [Altibacter sp. HG106]MDC7993614.1 helix-turn-helix domain-containing protein [Altibacter sp. HG106]